MPSICERSYDFTKLLAWPACSGGKEEEATIHKNLGMSKNKEHGTQLFIIYFDT